MALAYLRAASVAVRLAQGAEAARLRRVGKRVELDGACGGHPRREAGEPDLSGGGEGGG